MDFTVVRLCHQGKVGKESIKQHKSLTCVVRGTTEIGLSRGEMNVHRHHNPIKAFHTLKNKNKGGEDEMRIGLIERQIVSINLSP
jgi:hypothetical protein